MIIPIWITRGCGGSLTSRGLGNVYVWFKEPCINIEDPNEEPWQLDNTFRDSLYGILYDKNVKYNFLYRSENDRSSPFGDKLIRNGDGIDIPEKLIELEKQGLLRFNHEVYGDGLKTGYKPTRVPLVFGYESEISRKIWSIIIEEFGDTHQLEWSTMDEKKPFYRFCKMMEIEINLAESESRL
jgi:hypothetical protein